MLSEGRYDQRLPDDMQPHSPVGMPRQRRKIVNLIKTGTLDQVKYKNRLDQHPRRLGKMNKTSTKTQMNFKREVMPGSGAGSYTNYQLNPKSNPYLALAPVNIAGYSMG